MTIPPANIMSFPLRTHPNLRRGFTVTTWDRPHIRQTPYLIAFVDYNKHVAYGIRIPPYFVPRIALANLYRAARCRLRLLPTEIKQRITCLFAGHKYHHLYTATDDPGNGQPCVTTATYECQRCGKYAQRALARTPDPPSTP